MAKSFFMGIISLVYNFYICQQNIFGRTLAIGCNRRIIIRQQSGDTGDKLLVDMEKKDQIINSIYEFIRKYAEMEIDELVINCPYWMNKFKDGKVAIRGFANGKGSAEEIREELIRRLKSLSHESQFELTIENLVKFAKRERIGIDCSGLIYKVLDELLHLGYGNTNYKNLDNIFSGGIDKTNVKRLTSLQYSREIKNIKDFKLGDMIRLWGGKHTAIIILNNQKKILYAHSSSLSTKIQGVHTSIIQIIELTRSLKDQRWLEKARTGENFGKKYFSPEEGDGVFRLKIFS